MITGPPPPGPGVPPQSAKQPEPDRKPGGAAAVPPAGSEGQPARPPVAVNKGFPFGVSILSLVMLIVVPLAIGLLALGWRAASTLERDSVDLRMTALETAVTEWLTGGLRVIVAVGETLRGAPVFAFDPTGAADDADRQAQLAGVVDRHPSLAAAYVGYRDGTFLYAGRLTARDAALRPELSAPAGDNMRLCCSRLVGADVTNPSWSKQPHPEG